MSSRPRARGRSRTRSRAGRRSPRSPNCGIPEVVRCGQSGGVPTRAPRILIVDDHPLFRSVARSLLTARGYVVVGEADDARTAVQAAERLAPDGVLLDVRLGADCGLDVARALTDREPSPVVVLISVDHPY